MKINTINNIIHSKNWCNEGVPSALSSFTVAAVIHKLAKFSLERGKGRHGTST